LFDRDFETSVDTSRSRGWGAAGSREWASAERESLAISLSEAGSGRSSLAASGSWRFSHRLGDL